MEQEDLEGEKGTEKCCNKKKKILRKKTGLFTLNNTLEQREALGNYKKLVFKSKLYVNRAGDTDQW